MSVAAVCNLSCRMIDCQGKSTSRCLPCVPFKNVCKFVGFFVFFFSFSFFPENGIVLISFHLIFTL